MISLNTSFNTNYRIPATFECSLFEINLTNQVIEQSFRINIEFSTCYTVTDDFVRLGLCKSSSHHALLATAKHSINDLRNVYERLRVVCDWPIPLSGATRRDAFHRHMLFRTSQHLK